MSSVRGRRELGALAESLRLFGRDRELALIGELFEHIGAGGRSLLIRGEAGIGKSALLGEARRRAANAMPNGPLTARLATSPTLLNENGGNG